MRQDIVVLHLLHLEAHMSFRAHRSNSKYLNFPAVCEGAFPVEFPERPILSKLPLVPLPGPVADMIDWIHVLPKHVAIMPSSEFKFSFFAEQQSLPFHFWNHEREVAGRHCGTVPLLKLQTETLNINAFPLQVVVATSRLYYHNLLYV